MQVADLCFDFRNTSDSGSEVLNRRLLFDACLSVNMKFVTVMVNLPKHGLGLYMGMTIR
jgi:hypothetical protein